MGDIVQEIYSEFFFLFINPLVQKDKRKSFLLYVHYIY